MKKLGRLSLITLTVAFILITAISLFACSDDPQTTYYTLEYSALEGGSITGTLVQSVKHGESATQVIAVPNTGYEFVKWSDGKTEAERTDSNIIENKTVTAEFAKKTYTIRYLHKTGGIITGVTTQTVPHGETGTKVVAVLNNGYEFVKWSDGKTEVERTDSNITENKTVTAEFRKKTYTVKYAALEGGSITGVTAQTMQHGENGTKVIAVPDYGYEFVKWSDGLTDAARTDSNITENKTVTAEFKTKQVFYVTYKTFNNELGEIQETESQNQQNSFTYSIPYGESAPQIFAKPKTNFIDEEFAFLYWSDGVTTQERQDFNITGDKTLIAYFGYRIAYKVNGNIGGRIEGKASQLVLPGEKGEEVRAVAAPGYTFTGWSNLTWKETTIDDPNHEWGIFGSRHLEIIAYFEPTEKTFTYDYCYEIGAPYKTTQITLDRNAIDEAEFVIPQREGYTFGGWYADKDYTTRITTENGRYMYGYAAFTLETDTLYARWEKEDEPEDNHKILMVFVDEIQTTLYSSVVDKDIEVESKMVALEYELAKWTVLTMYSLLNEWFDGKIKFEVDSYYTTQTVTEGFDCGLYNGDFYDYGLFANDIAEIGELNYAYNNTITTIGCHDYDNKLFQVSGVAGIKNAFVTRDTTWYHCKINNILPQNHLKKIIEGKIDLNETIVETCLVG